MGIRTPDLAGSWYPGGERECRKAIEGYIDSSLVPKEQYHGLGGIVPHAGWYFSGKTALAVLYSISKKKKPDIIFLFGMHLSERSPDYIFMDEGFKTPLGIIKVHLDAARKLCDSFDFIKEDAHSYSQDNTIEIQLPFIKHLFDDSHIVAICAAPTTRALKIGEKAASIAQELGLDACFIGSTDLTHYGPNYGFTPQGIGPGSVRWVKETNDKKIVDSFLRAEPLDVLRIGVSAHNACCPGAASAAIAAVKKMGGKKGILVKYTTSYDIHPDSSFVGYAGVVY